MNKKSSLPKEEYMPTLSLTTKFVISIVWDLFDFTVFRIIGLGTFMDVMGGILTTGLWGKRKWWSFWEVLDFTEQIDAAIPTVTIAGVTCWIEMRKSRVFSNRKK
jgi:hypothetical protein